MSIYRAGNKIIIGILERVTDWLSQTGSSMYPALPEDRLFVPR
jgi:hypothetical protein